MKMTKIRYALDDTNRLLVSERARAAERLRPVRTVEGILTADRANRLVYTVASSSSGDGRPGPKAVVLDGTWRLTRDHALAFTLRGTDRIERRALYLKGALVTAETNAVVFALRRQEDEDLSTAERLTLSGRWQADARNRLNFFVEKARGEEDRLVFQNGWEIGPRHELVYRYRRQALARPRGAHILTFDGAWDVPAADRLVYRLSGSSDSAFEFKAALQSRSLSARNGRLVYQIGIGLSQTRTERRRVTLFGAWKLNRDRSVSFEIPYGDGRVQAIRFEGSARLSPRDRIAVALTNSRRQPLGLSVTFTRELVPDAELFLRLRRDTDERSTIGGVRVRF